MVDKVTNFSNITFSFCLLVLLKIDLLCSYFLNERVQSHEIDILEMVVTSACLF